MSISQRLVLLASLLCAFAAPASAADADAVGMVLDLQGEPQVTENGKTLKLQLLARLAPDMRIEVPASARASVTMYANRSVYRLTGPTVVDVTRDGLKLVRGSAPEIREMGQKMAALAPGGTLVSGAYRMRGLPVPTRVVLASPEGGSVLLDPRPRFAWQAPAATRFRVTLQPAGGGSGYSATVDGHEWSLPDGAQLEWGKSYAWTVVSVPAAGTEAQTARGSFSLATKAEADELSALKPADADPIEDWVYYAVMLQQRQIRGEARTTWQRIARQRPDLQQALDLGRAP